MKNTKKIAAIAVITLSIILSLTALSLTGCDNGTTPDGGTAPAITTAALPGGTAGTAYSQTLAATGDTPITWSIETGSLPDGLTLSTAGVISGTPETADTFNFTVKATNAAGSGTKALSIVIAPAPDGGTAPAITTAALPGGTAGTAYSQTIAAIGDTPITWSIETGSLPGGLTLSTAGVISGTPETADTFNFTVKATNAVGSGTKALSIVIAPDTTPPILSNGIATRTGETTARVSFASSEAGNVYFIIQNSGAPAPSNTTVKTTGYPWGTIFAGSGNSANVGSLPSYAFDAYIVVEDAAGNISEPLKIAVAAYVAFDGDITGKTVAEIKTGIETQLDAGKDVTVTGTLTTTTSPLVLIVPTGRTLNWEAGYTTDDVVEINANGDFVIASGGSITSSKNGYTVFVSGNGRIIVKGAITATHNSGIGVASDLATIIVDGGTITSINNAIQVWDTAKVIIKNGAVTTTGADAAITLGGTAKLAILGGSVSANTTGFVLAFHTSTVYVGGNYIADGEIWNFNSAATGYYATGFAGKFRTGQADSNFTPGTDLFAGTPTPIWW